MQWDGSRHSQRIRSPVFEILHEDLSNGCQRGETEGERCQKRVKKLAFVPLFTLYIIENTERVATVNAFLTVGFSLAIMVIIASRAVAATIQLCSTSKGAPTVTRAVTVMATRFPHCGTAYDERCVWD